MIIRCTTTDPKIQENTKSFFYLLENPTQGFFEPLLAAPLDFEAYEHSSGCTLLHLAVGQQLKRIVVALLDRGADIDSGDHYEKKTALHHATLDQRIEMLALLLERGADPEARNLYGTTALHFAAVGNDKKLLQLLLNAGANINAANGDGFDARALATTERDKKNIKLIDAHTKLWNPRYDEFCAGQFHPQTPAEWLGLASVMKLSDPKAYSSVADRVAQLMDWHKSLQALRTEAAKQSPAIGELGV